MSRRKIQRLRPCSAAVLLLLLAAWPVTSSLGQTPQPDAPEYLDVLFLGDDAHHQPEERLQQILPVLAARGIYATYTEDLDALNPERLRRFDVLMIYGNKPSISEAQEQALLDFVAEGGGLVAIHSASACFSNSDAYISLVGGAFKSHGVGTFGTTVLKPDHPAVEGVPRFESWDETYVHMKHNPDKVVLAVREGDGYEEPWTWVRTHGEGRVFYTAWGHDARTWSKPGFHQLLEQGTRWAAGDWALTAGLTPEPLEYVEGELPNYPADSAWSVTGEPFTKLQEPLRPEASMQYMAVEPGFRVELFAADPDIVNPIDMTWDASGRLWITETVDYPNEFEPGRRGEDRIKILEDTDGDGRADTFTVFADSLNIPTSLTLSNGGIIVTQAPDVLFLKDTDGDDEADVREVLFSGFGTYDTHAGPSNLRYGLDNRIWGAVGYSGFRGAVGGDSLQFTQGLFRFAPDGSALEYMATTNNNTWGLGFSEEGLVFGSTANDNPSVHMAVPNRFYNSVRGWGPPILGTIADTSEFYPITDRVRQVDQHGRYTSGAGHALYTARSFPKEYWNRIAFVAGPTGHLLGKFALEPEGSSFIAHNQWNMLASRDEWFAPIQAKVGPDGALWVIDWYNLIIQHNPTPEGYETGEGNAYETELRDRQRSRIYRVVFEGSGNSEPMTLEDATPEELVQALRHDNMFWRLLAQRLLVERGETDVLPPLYALVRDETTDEIGLNPGATHALWAMHGLGALDGTNEEALAVATAALHHPSSGVRRAALMVLPHTGEARDAILEAGLLPDPTVPDGMDYTVPASVMGAGDPQVRLAALLTLAEMPASEEAGTAIAQLLRVPANATDRWIRDAATAAGARHHAGFLAGLLEAGPYENDADSTYLADMSATLRIVAHHYAAGGPSGATASSLLLALEQADSTFAGAFLAGMIDGWPEGVAPSLSEADRGRLSALPSKLPPGLKGQLQQLAERWGQPDLFAGIE